MEDSIDVKSVLICKVEPVENNREDNEYITPDTANCSKLDQVFENVSSVANGVGFKELKKEHKDIFESTLLPAIRPTLCELCNTGFPNAELLETHVNKVHKDKLRYCCRFCKKRFNSFANRKLHETSHTEATPITFARSRKPLPGDVYNCPTCGRTFPYKSTLKLHIETIHENLRPFSCDLCKQAFKLKKDLKRHTHRVHELGTKAIPRRRNPNEPCVCKVCGKSFNVPYYLTRHMRLHTGELPYECGICQKKFRLADSLRVHKKSHKISDTSGLRSYQCRICGKSELQRFSTLNNHLNQVHAFKAAEDPDAVKPFACGICEKPYYLGIDAIICGLLAHDPANLQDKMFRYKCPLCLDHFGFYCLPLLRDHMEREHPLDKVPDKYKTASYFKDAQKIELPKVIVDQQRHHQLKNGVGMPEEVDMSPFPIYMKLGIRPELHRAPTKLKIRLNQAKTRRRKNTVLIESEATEDSSSIKHKKLSPGTAAKSTQATSLREEPEEEYSAEEKSRSMECKFCGKSFLSTRRYESHQLSCTGTYESSRNVVGRVLVSNDVAVKKLLNHRNLSVLLTRLESSVKVEKCE